MALTLPLHPACNAWKNQNNICHNTIWANLWNLMSQRRFSMPEQEYNEEKVTIIMKLMTIKLFMLYIFAASFCKPLNKQSKKIIFWEMTEITTDKKLKWIIWQLLYSNIRFNSTIEIACVL